jgi:hypothetical protein
MQKNTFLVEYLKLDCITPRAGIAPEEPMICCHHSFVEAPAEKPTETSDPLKVNGKSLTSFILYYGNLYVI